MILLADVIALGLRLRSYTPREWEAMGITPAPEEWAALVQLRKLLERAQSNYLVRQASPEDRAQLDAFYTAIAPNEDRGIHSIEDRIAAHAKGFWLLTKTPQPSWIEQQRTKVTRL